jgi:hypothetical protein
MPLDNEGRMGGVYCFRFVTLILGKALLHEQFQSEVLVVSWQSLKGADIDWSWEFLARDIHVLASLDVRMTTNHMYMNRVGSDRLT